MELNTHTEHEHASLNIKVLLLIFTVLLVAVLGYLVWNENRTTTDDSTTVRPKATTSTTTTTADPTAGWKTFTKYFDTVSGEQGYSIKYPTDWETSSEDLNSAAAIWEYGLRPTSLKNDYLVGISYYDGSLSEVTEIVKGIYNPTSTFLGQTNVQVGKETGTRLDFSNNTSNSLKPSVYLVEKCSDGCFTVGISGPGTADSEETEAIIKKMIGTFQLATKS